MQIKNKQLYVFHKAFITSLLLKRRVVETQQHNAYQCENAIYLHLTG